MAEGARLLAGDPVEALAIEHGRALPVVDLNAGVVPAKPSAARNTCCSASSTVRVV